MPAPGSSRGLSQAQPVPFDNVVYAVSFYEPYAVTSTGAEYDANYQSVFEEHRNYLLQAKNSGKSVWIQEFGINIDYVSGEPPSQSRLQWVQDVCVMAKNEKIGWSYWVYSKGPEWGYALLDSDGGERTVVGILKEALSI